MAVELHIFIDDSRIPSRDALQRAIDLLGFPTVLDSSLDLRRDSGFAPATYKGEDAGFEVYLDSAADLLAEYPHVASKVGSRDRCVSFRLGGNLTQFASALSAAAALAKLADGVYFYPDDDIIYEADAAIEATRRDLSLL